MKKFVLLVLALFLVAPYAVQAAPSKYETKVEWGVNFRAKPSPDASQYRMLQKGEKIHVMDEVGSHWLKVKTQAGKVGYISAAPKFTNYQSSSNSKADRIIAHAKSLRGKVSYDFGTRNPKRLIFDCSSFTEYVFEKQGVELKWGTRYQQYAGKYVSKSNLKKGDLVFFGTSSKNRVNHVGIYIGNGQFIHNKPSADGVAIDSLNKGFWKEHYSKARRVL